MDIKIDDYVLTKFLKDHLTSECNRCYSGKQTYLEEYTTPKGRKQSRYKEKPCDNCNGDHEEVLTDTGRYLVEFINKWCKG